MSYELGQLEGQISQDFMSIDKAMHYYAEYSNSNIAIEEFITMVDVSMEGSKFELTTSYIERIYTTLLSIITKITNFVRKMWTRINLGVRSDEKVKALLAELKDNTGETLEMTKPLKELIEKHIAYFYLKNNEVDFEESDINDILKVSIEARKDMLDGEPINMEIDSKLYLANISKDFNFKIDTSKFKSEVTFLSVKGKNVNLLLEKLDGGLYGSGYNVESATLKNKLFSRASGIVEKNMSYKSIYNELDSMMGIDNLYRVLVDGLFEEISAIGHDLEASRLRMLKASRSVSEGTIDDIEVHNANIRAHSQSARIVAGMSKALMYIGNGMIYDRSMRIRVAVEAVKQLEGEA